MAIEMTLTARGQFTFNKALLEHLGIKAGEKILIEKCADGSLSLRSVKNRVSAKSLIGILKTDVYVSDEDIEQAIERGYVESGIKGLDA